MMLWASNAHIFGLDLSVVCVCLFGRFSTGEQLFEGTAELDRHRVVKNRVDGRVHKDHYSTKQYVPVVLVSLRCKTVVDDVKSVRHP